MILAGLFFAAMHASVRYVSADMHPFEIGFFRQFFAFLLFVPWIFRNGGASLRTRRMGMHVLRAAANVVSLLLWFYALSIVPLAEATTLNFSNTLIVTIAAGIILGETVGVRRWIAVALGFVGVFLVIRPGFAEVNLGGLLVIAAAVFVATAKIATKSLSRTESSPTIVMYTALLVSPLALMPALFIWEWPTLAQLAWLVAIAALGTAAHLILTQSYKAADLSALEPASLVRLIWATVIGMIAFGESPDSWAVTGAVVIAISVAYLAVGERAAQAKASGRAAIGD